MQPSLKRKLVIGLAALAAAAFAGGAYAAVNSAAPDTRQAFLNDVAKRLHVTPQQLTAALNGATLDQLQAAVKSGRLTQAEANALEQRLKQRGTAPDVPFGLFGPRLARPWLGGGLRLADGPGGLPAAASYLGLSDTQLFGQLSRGKSLAQIATSRGKSVTGLEQAMTTAMKARLDKLVAAKVITAAQEEQILSRWSARLSEEVNQKGLPFERLRLRRPPLPDEVPAPPGAPAPAPPASVPLPYGYGYAGPSA